MRKIILILVFCVFAAGASWAQNNAQAMRFLTINALLQYGEKLYDRGDFNGACAVFNHVLTYDGHQALALQFLKDMGRSPLPASHAVLQPQASSSFGPVDLSDTESLKKAIEAKEQSIAKLRVQIMRMRANLASQSAGNNQI